MEKKDIKTNDDRQIFLEHTQTLIHSLAHTFRFPFCSNAIYTFPCLHLCVAHQFDMYTLYGIYSTHVCIITRQIYFLFVTRAFHPLSLILLFPSFVIIFRYILSHDLRQYHNMTLELNSTWISITKGQSLLFVSFVQFFFHDFFSVCQLFIFIVNSSNSEEKFRQFKRISLHHLNHLHN